MPEKIKTIIGEAIGEASRMWNETPKGVFKADKANELFDRTLDKLHSAGFIHRSEIKYPNKKISYHDEENCSSCNYLDEDVPCVIEDDAYNSAIDLFKRINKI